MKNLRPDQALPIPKLPETLPELDEAVRLLGARSAGQDLKAKLQDRLKDLLGAYPKPNMARAWKTQLKSVRDEFQ